MDTGILMTNPSVIATGLILIPVSLLIAFVLPGNRVIPLGDLPNLISIMSVLTLVMGGNVVRAVLAGIPIVATFMLVASNMAPVFTKLALAAGMNLGHGSAGNHRVHRRRKPGPLLVLVALPGQRRRAHHYPRRPRDDVVLLAQIQKNDRG